MKKIFFKIREDIPTKPIEVNNDSKGNAREEPVFFDTTDHQETREKELWRGEKEARNAIRNDPPVITVSCYYANDLRKDTTIVNIAQLTKPSRILIEQDSDPTLLNFKRKMLGIPFEEQFLLNDARYMHFPETKNVLSSKMVHSVDKTITILAKLVTDKSFRLDNYSKCYYYNHYMEEPANIQAFQK